MLLNLPNLRLKVFTWHFQRLGPKSHADAHIYYNELDYMLCVLFLWKEGIRALDAWFTRQGSVLGATIISGWASPMCSKRFFYMLPSILRVEDTWVLVLIESCRIRSSKALSYYSFHGLRQDHLLVLLLGFWYGELNCLFDVSLVSFGLYLPVLISGDCTYLSYIIFFLPKKNVILFSTKKQKVILLTLGRKHEWG